ATYAGIRRTKDPVPLNLPPAQLKEYAGVYSTEAVILTIKVSDDHLVIHNQIRPETLKALVAEGQEPPPTPPIPFKIAAGDVGVVHEGEAKGMRFVFSRD